MRFINITPVLFLLLWNFSSSAQMAVVKGVGSFPESPHDDISGEAAQDPEAADVRRTEKPKTDSLNDAVQAKVPEDLKEPASLASLMAKMKRCAGGEVVASKYKGQTISLSRRDVPDLRNRQCEFCKNGRLCKRFDKCKHCATYCDDVIPANGDDHKGEANENASNNDFVLGSRFKETEEKINRPRYYSLGLVEPGPLMRLFAKIFNIPENFEKLILLGKIKDSEEDRNADDIVIIDLAQVFHNEKKVVGRVQKVDNNGAKIDMDFIQKLDKDLENAIMSKLQQNGNAQFNKDEINGLVDDAFQNENNIVESALEHTTPTPETETRCSVDESIENLPRIIQKNGESHAEQKPEVEYEHPQNQEKRSENISNPPVIQDNYNMLGDKQLEEYVDDNEEAKSSAVNVLDVPKILPAFQDVERLVPLKEAATGTIAASHDTKPISLSNNQISKPHFKERANVENQEIEPLQKLENNVAEVSEDLDLVPEERNLMQKPEKKNVEEEPFESFQESKPQQMIPSEAFDQAKMNEESTKNPAEVLEKNVINVMEDGLKVIPNRRSSVKKDDQISGSNSPKELEENVINVVEDSLKVIPTKQDSIEEIRAITEQNSPRSAHGDLIREQQIEVPSEELTKNIFKAVDTGLKAAPVFEIVEEKPAVGKIPQETKSEANAENAVREYEVPPPSAKAAGEFSPPEVNARSRILNDVGSEEKPNYFGALVPAKDIPLSLNPSIKNIFYVGDDVHLPLKMIQDENGVVKLRVDTDALCNCDSKNCTKRHIVDRFKHKARDNGNEETETILPELQVRFGRENRNEEDLSYDVIDDLHKNDEVSEIFKRSPSVNSDGANAEESFETVKLKNKIKKLNENLATYNEVNKDLLNKTTKELYKNIQKSKAVERMVNLTNDLLAWMKEVANDRTKSAFN